MKQKTRIEITKRLAVAAVIAVVAATALVPALAFAATANTGATTQAANTNYDTNSQGTPPSGMQENPNGGTPPEGMPTGGPNGAGRGGGMMNPFLMMGGVALISGVVFFGAGFFVGRKTTKKKALPAESLSANPLPIDGQQSTQA